MLDKIRFFEKRLGAFERRLDAIDSKIAEVRLQGIDGPRIAAQAEQIGKRYKTKLRTKNERYLDENH